mgnify:CR=1 FL=1
MLIEKKEKKCIEYSVNVYIDFEAYSDKNKQHIAYLCCFDLDEIKAKCSPTKHAFYGNDCGFDMLCYLEKIYNALKNKLNLEPKTRLNFNLIAHNASYDFNFIVRHLIIHKQIANGKNVYASIGMFKKMHLYVKDSYKMISSPLRDFGEIFKLDQEKECMPYNIYNEETINKVFYKIEDLKNNTTND